MRAGVSTVQQTLTTEAANVLKLSVAEAQRRGHAQVTPLHVATTLLTGSSSVLRQACIQSHLHISQPPQCRGLELCFNVALDRLQTTTTTSSSSNGGGIHQQQQQQPALSNALVAALKRAQAHQRRGYPEQQQVPLLAVKVEMEQLIISILDDPSVSRVMREAGFTSTQVKSSLEEALGAAAAAAASAGCSSQQQPRILHPPGAAGSVDRLRLKLGSFEQLGLKLGGVGSLLDSCEQYAPSSSSSSSCLPFLQSRHHHHMPGLLLHERSNGFRSNAHHPQQQQQPGNVLLAMRMGSNNNNRSSSGHEIDAGRRSQDAARVMEIFLKPRKRNPLLIGEQPPHGVIEEVIQRLDKGECEASLRNTRLISPQFASIALGLHGKEEVEHKLGELGRAVDECVRSAGGAVVFLGDLQWLVERPPPPPPASPPPSAGASSAYCPVQHAVSEIGRMMLNGNRVWLMGVASSQTYMRCQARHPSLEMLWGLQPLPISTGFSLSLRGSSTNRFLDGKANGTPAAPNAVEISPLRAAPVRWPLLPFNFSSSSSAEDGLENCCPDCTAKYEQELVLLQEQEKDVSSHDERTSNGLPFWLKPNKDTAHQANGRVQKMKELQRRWSQTCQNLHGPLRSATYASVAASNCKVSTSTSGSLPMSIPWLSLQSAGSAKGIATPPQVPEKNGLTVNGHGKDVGSVCTSSIDDVLSTQIGLSLKPPVRTTHEQQEQQQQEAEVTVQTDLVLGRSKSSSNGSVTNGKLSNFFDVKAHRERVEGLSGCTPSSFGFPRLGPCPMPVSEKRYPAFIHEKLERTERQVPAAAAAGNNQTFKPKELDFKGLCRALAESVPWQREAIDSIASTVLQCRSGVERRRGVNLKCDAWLLFLGSDIMAKRKVARILAEQVFGCEKMFFRMSLRSQAERQSRGQEQDSEVPAGRGRTPLDRLAEAVRAKPFSVLLLEDIEQADSRLKNALMKAMESGRLADSSGREVSVANLIVVMTSSLGENFLPKESSFRALDLSEKRLASAEIVGMKLLLDEPATTGAVLHKSERVAIVNHSRILLPAENTSEELQNGLHSKRKAGSTDLLESTPEKRNKVEARGVEFDLNMPVEEDQMVAKVHPEQVVTSKDGSPVKQLLSEENPVQQLLQKAFQHLSEGFCHRVNATIVFRPFDFDKLAELVLLEINSTVSATALPVEVESSVFEHLVAVLWEAQGKNEEFQRWVTQVLGTTISSLIEKLKPSSEHVIKLVADKSADPVLHLPRTIRIGDHEP